MLIPKAFVFCRLGSIGNQAASNGYNPNFYNHAGRKSPTSKLLVGSTFVNPKDPSHPIHQPHGYLPDPPPSPSSILYYSILPFKHGISSMLGQR